MGIFDLPAPVLFWLDALVSPVPPVLRLTLWGALGALLSMGLYLLLSDQDRIAAGKRELTQARRRLNEFDGEFAGAWPLMRAMFSASLHQIARTGRPALVASLPLLSIIAWLSTAYGHAYPAPGAIPEIETRPPQLEGQWVTPPRNAQDPEPRRPYVVLQDRGRELVAAVNLAAPVPVIHKRQWWNLFIGNPAGYLPPELPIHHLRIGLPEKRYLAFGPDWMRGWHAIFFTSLLLFSIAMKLLLRIE
ncbi:hypothetical protein [Thiohalobacter thiocyanaticus]|nr:hypothetical protein [Thiohalobacter thiocyanaticus]